MKEKNATQMKEGVMKTAKRFQDGFVILSLALNQAATYCLTRLIQFVETCSSVGMKNAKMEIISMEMAVMSFVKSKMTGTVLSTLPLDFISVKDSAHIVAMKNSKQLMVRDVILLLNEELATAVMKIVRSWMDGIVLLIKRDSLQGASKFPQMDSAEMESSNHQRNVTTACGKGLGVTATASHIQGGIAAEHFEDIRFATKYD